MDTISWEKPDQCGNDIFLWLSELWGECILCYPLFFIFLSRKYIMQSQRSKKALKRFNKQNADFMKTNYKKLLSFERELQRLCDDLSFQEQHLRREVRTWGVGTAKPWGFPRCQSWRVSVRAGIVVLIPVLYVVVISVLLILLKKREVNFRRSQEQHPPSLE